MSCRWPLTSAGSPHARSARSWPVRRPAHVVLDDDVALAFLDSRPLFPGHTLLVPRAHHETLADLPAPLVGPLFERARSLSAVMETALGAGGSFVADQQPGEPERPPPARPRGAANQGDGLRGFFWPRTKYGSEQEAAAMAARLRAAVDDAGVTTARRPPDRPSAPRRRRARTHRRGSSPGWRSWSMRLKSRPLEPRGVLLGRAWRRPRPRLRRPEPMRRRTPGRISVPVDATHRDVLAAVARCDRVAFCREFLDEVGRPQAQRLPCPPVVLAARLAVAGDAADADRRFGDRPLRHASAGSEQPGDRTGGTRSRSLRRPGAGRPRCRRARAACRSPASQFSASATASTRRPRSRTGVSSSPATVHCQRRERVRTVPATSWRV